MAKAMTSTTKRTRRPATSIEARQNQLVSLAIDQAEKQLLEGTASSQVITHFLKLGTANAELEREKLILENNLLKAKAESYKSAEANKELYEKAIKAFRNYSGQGDPDEY